MPTFVFPKADPSLIWPQCRIQRKDNCKQLGDIYPNYYIAYQAFQTINNSTTYELIEGVGAHPTMSCAECSCTQLQQPCEACSNRK